MLLGAATGPITEPLTGRRWEPDEVRRQVLHRAAGLRAGGIRQGNRVLIGYGNCLEFFADLLALWTVGACAIPLDARLTPFEIETLSRAARARAYIGLGDVDADLTRKLEALGTTVML
ncbi:MAG: AMP-binding protein, partial [Gemmatimonadota bacterium]|nr:AMP-binding protein [Gemmatimonadota bacterium]